MKIGVDKDYRMLVVTLKESIPICGLCSVYEKNAMVVKECWTESAISHASLMQACRSVAKTNPMLIELCRRNLPESQT